MHYASKLFKGPIRNKKKKERKLASVTLPDHKQSRVRGEGEDQLAGQIRKARFKWIMFHVTL